jgi:hypothetical protein
LDRVLLFQEYWRQNFIGGGRNLDFETENTTDFGQTEIVQKNWNNTKKHFT